MIIINIGIRMISMIASSSNVSVFFTRTMITRLVIKYTKKAIAAQIMRLRPKALYGPSNGGGNGERFSLINWSKCKHYSSIFLFNLRILREINRESYELILIRFIQNKII